ncbi:MAG: hypothetical protein A2836_02950 [Candidatus Taylorbacteria bacterium RIFCSPHIGHO2_01_FULL_45_63]|uniref:PrgI family protein n=1 Tax=Candidatus Taylorbacteria bacterium RIFCSPHIGHO2_02_FULL_45_35 TaxID=1802311 RepID=A0A1G2MWY0_9BACT|nr:MAG: hypothetical protein A2836_02950 [Candidatus Taylorbacteria bacterium RIFCSPHIGHO2_01_FULL_45_63]OHA27552.1 MAG: hypothetical protein A3D56_02545 [Candidatus Taylorbacteria bacterium RIFCSPHIGHO2_02_FULL_45_35]OHA34181.1 MAG: hypothetical protein A3A22_00790 [Candidatus Taylorbacteria bacterium RIFCSPLOWO2_01_FULL_45_34b]
MRFQVPQFIGVEDKIFGPLTIKQFIYLAGCIGLSIIWWRFTPKYISIPLIIPTLILGLALAFYKFNNKPFIFFIESAFGYLLGNKLYIWRKEAKKPEAAEDFKKELRPSLYVPKLSESKLKDLTWSLDIRENLNPGTREMGGERK